MENCLFRKKRREGSRKREKWRGKSFYTEGYQKEKKHITINKMLLFLGQQEKFICLFVRFDNLCL